MCTMPCSLRPWYRRKSLRYCSRACPTPATLPWPKMPSAPPKNACSSPSRSTRWAARKRTTAWPTVRRVVSVVLGTMSFSFEGSAGVARDQRETAVEAGGRPLVLGRLEGRVLEGLKGALGSRAGQHVEVVEVLPVRRDRGVVAPRDEEQVAVAHGLDQVEVALGGVHALQRPAVLRVPKAVVVRLL